MPVLSGPDVRVMNQNIQINETQELMASVLCFVMSCCSSSINITNITNPVYQYDKPIS